ncbi:MAG TPA: hypothetical protein VM901_11990 [Bdellovibrionota bacterium]|nr:hypothetical protein [Bdellovibrionota bacterium]
MTFLAFFALGFSYFYPAHSPLAQQEWFTQGVVPTLDTWLVQGRHGAYSGHLVNSQGELKYKSDADFVFYPARGGQRFYGKTMIASGFQTGATIEVAVGVQVQLEANSLIVIEPPVDGLNEGPVIRVIGGAAVAQAKPNAVKKVRVVAPSGMSKVVDLKGVAVVADGKGYVGELTSNISELRESFASQDLQKLEHEKLMREEALKAETLRAEALRAQELATAKAKADAQQDFVLNQVDEPVRAPASKVEIAHSIEIPQKITRRKFDDKLVGTGKEAPATEVAKGIYQAKRGQNAAATRSFASALASPLYGVGEDFNPSVQIALDGILESYEMNRRCAQARETLSNVLGQYKSNRVAQGWGTQWSTRLASGRCKNAR